MEVSEILVPIANSVSKAFDAPVQILTAGIRADGKISGCLLSDGFFKYDACDRTGEINIEYLPNETQELNDYAEGFLLAKGVHVDSAVNTYEYAQGFLRLDVKCSGSNKPCGGRCLPKGQNCRSSGSGGASNLKQSKSNLAKVKSPNGGKALATAAGIAGGVALAGAAGIATAGALKSRTEIGRGAKAVGERLKRAGSEGSEHIKTGVNSAKEILNLTKETNKEKGEAYKATREYINASDIPEESKRSTKRLSHYAEASEKLGTTVSGVGTAAGAVATGLEEGARAAGKNLKEAGKDVARTGKAVAQNTKEMLFGKGKPKSESSKPEVEVVKGEIVEPGSPAAAKASKAKRTTTTRTRKPKA